MADIVIDSSIEGQYPDRAFQGSFLTYVDNNTGYLSYLDASSTVKYRKTDDGGQTWAADVTIRSNTDHVGVCCWYDRCTPQDPGFTLYNVFINRFAQVYYRSLNTQTDAQGTLRTLATITGGGLADLNAAVTKSRGGRVYVAYQGPAEHAMVWSTDDFATINTVSSPFEGAVADQILLFPANLANADSIWALYWDVSADEISLKTYSAGTDDWTTVAEASIWTSMVDPASTAVNTNMAGCIRHSDGHLLVAAWSEYDTATADLKCVDITNAGTITGKTNLITDKDDCFGCSMFIDQNTNDVYVGIFGKSDGSEDAGNAVNVWYFKSTDGMATWGAQVQYSEDAADDHRTLSTSLGGFTTRFALAWANDDLDDMYTGYTNSIAITQPLSPGIRTRYEAYNRPRNKIVPRETQRVLDSPATPPGTVNTPDPYIRHPKSYREFTPPNTVPFVDVLPPGRWVDGAPPRRLYIKYQHTNEPNVTQLIPPPPASKTIDPHWWTPEKHKVSVYNTNDLSWLPFLAPIIFTDLFPPNSWAVAPSGIASAQVNMTELPSGIVVVTQNPPNGSVARRNFP